MPLALRGNRYQSQDDLYRYQSQDNLSAECFLIEMSGLFDAAEYRRTAGLSPDICAAKHYLREGWRRGFEPGPNFDGNFFLPYYQSVGLNGPPLLTYLTLQSSGAAVFTKREQAEAIAVTIRNSELFDPVGYAARVGGIGHLDPALHYLIVGEHRGICPSDFSTRNIMPNDTPSWPVVLLISFSIMPMLVVISVIVLSALYQN